ncbi:MAG TPA: choice-of-anchor L domain-containing protein [Bacteroidales bacterium]|nr:choice-of-anchor L domain-containing protein [Bacteroidales bacterium]
MKIKRIIFLIVLLTCFYGTSYSQLIISTNVDPVQSVTEFILSGVEATNVVFTGAETALGTFSNGSTTNLDIDNGIVLTTGTLSSDYTPAIGSPVGGFSSYSNNTDGDEMLNTLVSVSTFDASVLEFDLIPNGNVLEFQYVFASEEYPEFVNSSFNDVFAFFIDGENPNGGTYEETNIALIPDSNLPVCIDNVNSDLNSEYFIDNQSEDGQTIVFDGFTTLLTAQVNVVPETIYHLKLAIGDSGDAIYDSAVFLVSPSLKSYNLTEIETNEVIIPNIVYNNVTRKLEISNVTSNIEQISLAIYNIQGALVFEETISPNESIQLNEFKDGVYIIKISSDKIHTSSKLVVY